ncbi:DNA integrity scanning, DisA, linker region [Thermaerobacter marianensis DSM 12885]|uniref:DNA integrity scanning protein DisA n=1 Tax=Thermaerobacter marianensis (strain ATCC 700841 / DSM 12885 / JCM 10246 / 7p75a) TaxID=644966 RepID=E6SLF8_THEM7|nr:DNA integrity scanning diadenylate cyclase DisA [Thermaerobacter marianensis]ADU52400.1 DNA integrity scanning, DisA, linker region [Thermaerobacter marianensis DSM 12885]
MTTEDRPEALIGALRRLAPGTRLREGLDQILRARTGGLIVVGDGPEVLALCSGGFELDVELTPAHLYELAKMDGAIILSSDARRIVRANVQLIPDPRVLSFETGIRHRTAERMARQTGALVIAISQRRNVITVYRGELRYVLRDPALMLAKANQALGTLERYRAVFLQALGHLTVLEFEDLVTAGDVAYVLGRAEQVRRIGREIEGYAVELGTEGRLVRLQLDELQSGVEEEYRLVVRDYVADPDGEREALAALQQLPPEDLTHRGAVARCLGFTAPDDDETPVTPRGYRILHKLPRLPVSVVENLVQHFGSLPRILAATVEQLDDVEGIGSVRARAIKDGLRRLQDQAFLERRP